MSEIICNCGSSNYKYNAVLKGMFTVLRKVGGCESNLKGVKLTLYLLFIILGYLNRLLLKPELKEEFLDSIHSLVRLVTSETNSEDNGDPTNNQRYDVESSINVIIKYLLTVIEHLPKSEGLFPESYKVYQSCVELFETLRVSMWKPKALL
jgi:hypothetical protein